MTLNMCVLMLKIGPKKGINHFERPFMWFLGKKGGEFDEI